MTICWPQLPKDRPTSSQIVSILSAPEFLHLYDVMSMSHQSPILSVFHSPAMRTSGKFFKLQLMTSKIKFLQFIEKKMFRWRQLLRIMVTMFKF